MSVPPIESRVVERDLFRVGSGEQFMRVSITINCAGVSAPITTDEIVLIVQDDQGRTLLSQTVPYVKTWCQ